jgi:CRP-like cAMP-binding protein
VKKKATQSNFDCAAFLANAGLGHRILELRPKDTFFSQGDPANTVFYLQTGRAKLTVVAKNGKEATITLLSSGDFVGEESLASIPGLRLATASAINSCVALKVTREEMARVMHSEPLFADLFLKFLLARSMRTQADLIDQLFNSSEKRLARILLLMAEFGKPGERDTYIPTISQETLAGMIGTTRSRVSFFMNRFRKMGFISYNGRIQVNKSLLNVVLFDQFPGHNSQRPLLPKLETILKPVISIGHATLMPEKIATLRAPRKLSPLIASRSRRTERLRSNGAERY